MSLTKVKHYKVTQLPSELTPDSFYWIISGANCTLYVTDANGVQKGLVQDAAWLASTLADYQTQLNDRLKISQKFADLTDKPAARTNLGIGSVDNTSDLAKPVSTAQAAADAAILASAQTYADGAVTNLWKDQGSFDASGNAFPTASNTNPVVSSIKKGFIWTISVAGTIGGQAVNIGDTVRALINSPGQTTANWAIGENNIGYVPENTANKDASNGYAGLTLFKINFWNALNTFKSFFTNANTAARTYTFQDRNGTIADDADIAGAKARANHTGTQAAATISDFNAAALAAAPAETTASAGALISGATAKTAPDNADYLGLTDSAASGVLKKLSWANLVAAISSAAATLSNKTLDNTNAITVKDANLTIQDDVDATKQAKFQASGITTATTRTITLPDKSGTLAMISDITGGSAGGTIFTGNTAAVGGAAIAGNATNYLAPYQTSNGTESTRQILIPAAGTLKNLFIKTTTAQDAGGALTFTLRKNGVDTVVTLAIAAGAAAGTYSDTTNTAAVAAGDLISIKAVNGGSGASAGIQHWAFVVA